MALPLSGYSVSIKKLGIVSVLIPVVLGVSNCDHSDSQHPPVIPILKDDKNDGEPRKPTPLDHSDSQHPPVLPNSENNAHGDEPIKKSEKPTFRRNQPVIENLRKPTEAEKEKILAARDRYQKTNNEEAIASIIWHRYQHMDYKGKTEQEKRALAKQSRDDFQRYATAQAANQKAADMLMLATYGLQYDDSLTKIQDPPKMEE
ncbi:hypothetical protein Q7M08_03130 [Candidatus Liberibacter asiaticus]|uniref:hypothetical protein n=2 Tax=Liberibacter asiaticus TaxID=34021 RepID=UPI001FCE5811|nr:hypothetical protein [Candidatus Liberibacter asiaticus]